MTSGHGTLLPHDKYYSLLHLQTKTTRGYFRLSDQITLLAHKMGYQSDKINQIRSYNLLVSLGNHMQDLGKIGTRCFRTATSDFYVSVDR